MDKISNITKARLKENSLAQYAIRSTKDSCLHDDVEAYMSKHDTGLNDLVNKLLDNHFASVRHTDPEYPQ